MKSKNLIFLFFTIFLFVLLLGYLQSGDLLSGTRYYPTQNWKGIEPGKSLLKDVERLLGTADKVKKINDFTVLSYDNTYARRRQGIDWENIEIWFKEQSDSSRVEAVFLSYPYQEENPDSYTMKSLVELYGKPNFITWSKTPHMRYLGWTERGIAINVWLYPRYRIDDPDISKLRTHNVLLFEPMRVQELEATQWPWTIARGWSYDNLFPIGISDAPDEYPKDPFDWSKLLSGQN